jgi:hypothetical protein
MELGLMEQRGPVKCFTQQNVQAGQVAGGVLPLDQQEQQFVFRGASQG